MKAAVVRVRSFTAATAEELADAITTWIEQAGEATWIEAQYQTTEGGEHVALVFYTV